MIMLNEGDRKVGRVTAVFRVLRIRFYFQRFLFKEVGRSDENLFVPAAAATLPATVPHATWMRLWMFQSHADARHLGVKNERYRPPTDGHILLSRCDGVFW